MNAESSLISNSRFGLSGGLAGAFSAFVFAWIHDLLISDIWFSLLFMMAAGGICGFFVGWSFGLLAPRPSWRNWLVYNLIYDGLFGLLGLISVMIFDPVTTMAALIAADGPPDALIGEAMPVTLLFTLLMTILIALIYGFSWSRLGAVGLTCLVLVLLLGLNVSVIGLVEIPSGSWYLVWEMFGLILGINVVFAAGFLVLERKTLFFQQWFAVRMT